MNGKDTAPVAAGLYSPKHFNDSVHGYIQLHPFTVKFIDTLQFQRLRNIKQLGTCYYVYPGACHNRFEHCIGTCHLATKLLQQLKLNQPEHVTDRDALCVQIAALCHDLGHGPFSHMFDNHFIPQMRPGCKWTHEDGSCMMLKHLIEANGLEGEFAKHGLVYEEDLPFIQELINPPSKPSNMDEPEYKHRPKSKYFLYEIVSNKQNGVDVDKWDYFSRDCHHLGLPNSFDHNRVIASMKVVVEDDGVSHIAARDKDITALYEMFHVRTMLHRHAYQHRINHATETMIMDAMKLANNHLFYRGRGGKQLKLSDTIDDPVAYGRLSDNIIFDILNHPSDAEEMAEARGIINRIFTRDLYKLCGKVSVGNHQQDGGQVIKSELMSKFAEEILKKAPNSHEEEPLEAGDIFVCMVKINYGDKLQNPMEKFLFFTKSSPDKAFVIRADEISSMLPKSFQDSYICVYCRNKKHQRITERSFKTWCDAKGWKMTSATTVDCLTPRKRPSSFSSTNITAQSPCKRQLRFANGSNNSSR